MFASITNLFKDHRLPACLQAYTPGLTQTLKILTAGYITYKLVQWVKSAKRRRDLRQSVALFRANRDEAILELENGLEDSSEDMEEITELSLVKLTESLQSGEVTPRQVLRAYQRAALAAHKETKCITQFIAEAERRTSELEATYKGKTKPPLYGVPVSVKENINVKGYISTRGNASAVLENEVASRDAYIVQLLVNLGAVPFCRTNVPQTVAFNCTNPVYGATNHPLSKDRTPGGSSGGEAALLAMKGSPLGIGSDVGGSIRIPCHYSGVCGLKPTSTRFTQVGCAVYMPGKPAIEASLGPMARSAEDLAFAMEVILNRGLFNMDPLVSPVPFRSEVYHAKRELKIGVYFDNGILEAVPACVEAVICAKNALEARGHCVVQSSPYRHTEGMDLFYALCFLDGGKYVVDQLKRDLVDPSYKRLVSNLTIPRPLLRALGFMMGFHSPTQAAVIRQLFNSTSDLRQKYARHKEYKREFIQNWQEEGLDGVICPANASAAMTHDGPMNAPACATYTAIYNVVDFPGGVVPTHGVTQKDVLLLDEYVTGARDPVKKTVANENRATIGYPVGVQVVTLPYHEEMCLRIMAEIERGLQ